MADFVRDRAGENQFGRNGISGSDDGIVSESGVFQQRRGAFCVRRDIDRDPLGTCRGAMSCAFYCYEEVIRAPHYNPQVARNLCV